MTSSTFVRDGRHALRALLRTPAFTAIAAATFGLGIGVNTAVFSVFNGVLLRPLPYPEPDRITMVWMDNRQQGITEDITSWPNYRDWRDQSSSFAAMAGFSGAAFNLTGAEEPERLQGAQTTANFFEVMGVRPLLGRLYTEANETPGNDGVVLISYGLWQRRFGGAADVLGKTMTLNGRAFEVIGVMPATLQVPAEAQLWKPLAPDEGTRTARGAFWLPVIGRLKPGIPVEQAQTEMTGIATRLEQTYSSNQGFGINLVPLHRQLVGDIERSLVVLLASVGFVLLIACANLGNLMLGRTAARRKELAIRTALGANRAVLVRQIITEALVLAAIGSALGLIFAYWATRLFVTIGGDSIPRPDAIAIDGRVMGFTLAIAIVAALLAGIVPALQASRPAVVDTLREGGREGATGSSRRTRQVLIAAEVALAFVLLVGCGLMIRTFIALQNANPGFDPENVLTFLVQNNRAQGVEGRQAFQRTLLERLKAIPGVVDATSAGPIPLDGGNSLARYGPVEAATDPSKFQQAIAHFVQPGYFEFARTPVIAGRPFTEADNRPDVKAIIIDDLMAAQLFPNGNAVGQRMLARVTTPEADTFEVIGVIKHQRHTTMMNDGEEGMFFTDGYSQFGAAFRWAVRTAGNPEAITGAVRAAMAQQDPRLLMTEPRTWRSYLEEHVAPTRFALILIGVFAGVAAILAMIGLYGVLATTVRQRTTEIGVRMAFGATHGRILKLIIGQGLRLSTAGIIVGVLAAIALTRVMASLLVGVSATDPVTFATMAVVFALVATFAAWIPARRAAGLNPNVALRDE